MLTEIEWWGGFLFLWWAGFYYFTLKNWAWKKISLDYINTHIAFSLSAVALALYFYPLESLQIRYFYLGSVAVLSFSTVLMFVLPTPEKADTSTDADEDNEEEELGKGWHALGIATLMAPIIIPCTFGIYKSYGIAKELGIV